MARKKTENSYLSLKLAVRREAVAGLDQVRVLDAFGGRNTLWSQIPTDRYYGVEKQKGKGQNLPADNRRALESLNLADFNVIDLDAYGVPDTQLAEVFRSRSLQPGTRIIITAITGPMNGISSNLLNYYGLRGIFEKTTSIMNRYTHDLFLGWLAAYGIETLHGYIVDDRMRKLYAWFPVPANLPRVAQPVDYEGLTVLQYQ